MTAPLPGVSLDDPDLTRAVARAIFQRQHVDPWDSSQEFYPELAAAALAAVRAHLEEVGR